MKGYRKSIVKKEAILVLASEGYPRPEKGSELDSAIHNYCSLTGESYDEQFDVMLRELRPEWFLKRRNRGVTQKKAERVS